MTDQQREKILNLLDKNNYCVISSVTEDSKPESAVMAFSNTENIEIIFSTSVKTRKYRNIAQKGDISVAIGWDKDDFTTIQYEGFATELKNEAELKRAREIHIAKNPSSAEYAFKEGNTYFLVKPNWIRYSDLKESSYEVFEVTF